MKVKRHCRSGHVMKRDGESWRCTGVINGNKKGQKINCPIRKPWNRVTAQTGGIL